MFLFILKQDTSSTNLNTVGHFQLKMPNIYFFHTSLILLNEQFKLFSKIKFDNFINLLFLEIINTNLFIFHT